MKTNDAYLILEASIAEKKKELSVYGQAVETGARCIEIVSSIKDFAKNYAEMNEADSIPVDFLIKFIDNMIDEDIIERSCAKSKVISNVLAVLMTMDSEKVMEIVSNQDVETVYDMIYSEEDNNEE